MRKRYLESSLVGILLLLLVLVLVKGHNGKQHISADYAHLQSELTMNAHSSFGKNNFSHEDNAHSKNNYYEHNTEITHNSSSHNNQDYAVSDKHQHNYSASDKNETLNKKIYMNNDNFYYSELTEDIKTRITGKSYPADDSSAQIHYDDLRYVHVLHYDFNHQIVSGELICNKKIADDLIQIFYDLYDAQYEIERMELVDNYRADDETSMEANNSSAFNYRTIAGTSKLSNHSYGMAIDINPLYNPYMSEHVGIQPVNAGPYTDRNADFLHKITHDDLAYQLFIDHGFTWGGDWTSSKDYQHFEKKGVTGDGSH